MAEQDYDDYSGVQRRTDPTQYAEATTQEEQQPPPTQQQQATNRWSYHAANDPYGGAAGAWAKQFYDNPNVDPGAQIQNQIGAFRRQYGDAAPEDDVGVMEMIASGRAPQQQNQTASQQWNNFTAGTGGTGAESASGQQLMALLMQRAKQGLNVDRYDPMIRQQVDPLTAQMERATRDYIDTAAEGSMGRPFNMAGTRQMLAERLGQGAGQLESEVIGREIGARRNEIQAALAQWGDVLSNDQRAALEREMGYLSDRARTADRESAMEQFLRGLAQRQYEFDETSWFR